MSLEITGTLIQRNNTVQVNERFKKREFTLDITDNTKEKTYPNFAKMQATQERCEVLDKLKQGDILKVSFNIRGNKWEKDGNVNYITNLEAWKIEVVGNAPQQSQPKAQAPKENYEAFKNGEEGSLPF